MRTVTLCVAILLAPKLSGCAAGPQVSGGEFGQEVEEFPFRSFEGFPLRPWYARERIPGDPVNSTSYYGVQLKISF